MKTAFPHCRICGAPRVSYSSLPLCREHYNERRRSKKPPQKRGRKVVSVCRVCGGPRKEGISLALCADHYREYALRQTRKQRGMDPDAPVKKVDVTKCSRCDEPRLSYGTLCRAHHNAMHAERRRKAGVQTWAEHVARIGVSKPTCITNGCGEPTTSRFAKLCRACYERRQQAKVTASSRAKMTAAAKAPEKQIPRRWDTALPGRGIKEPVIGLPPAPVPVVVVGKVTVVRSADEIEREARAREWAEYLERRKKEYDA